ncbi:Hypothetical predicted protein [Pelobates cultripes]|uniref:Photoreceptor cilium actin regulator n=1 Tax=Pelobates cultripes TaxID=61616 RepID=A0AAD1RI54_PELCU|nr:Hypothetical predicted protein [Pelobates cultripes]
MGCSPSHSGIIQSIAKNAAKPLKKNKAILAPGQSDNGITIPLGKKSSLDSSEELCSGTIEQGNVPPEKFKKTSLLGTSATNVNNAKKLSVAENHVSEEIKGMVDESMVSITCQKGPLDRRLVRKQSSTGSELELGSEGPQENPRRSRRSKSQRSNKQGRRTKTREKQLVFSETEKKVDFPELLVKAHQDAYAYMNPNLSKYETVISLANQATQTQIILQQMVSFMALRFDEINQCLEEIAEDGENFLKNAGNNLTWPLGKGNLVEQPDLLQQLLQYTVNRMQTLNSTVSSLTSNALQEACTYLQSAATNFQGKFKVKQISDERLMRTIKLLEDSASGPIHTLPNDSTLYSEDSGIGGDSESIKECKSPDKMERRTSLDLSGQVNSKGIQQEIVNINVTGSSSADICAKDMVGPRFNNTRVPKQTSLATSLSMNSLDSSTTLEQDSNNEDSEDCTSSDDSCNDVENYNNLSSQITLPQRPMTSPAGAGVYKSSPKWLESSENEEMNLKMKEAISEKIKFVPETSSSNVWIREEEGTTPFIRPRTADGSSRRTSRHRRSRSAESLRSQSEDPTLLELQRTQKELNKKLERLMTSGNKNKETSQKVNIKSFVHVNDIMSVNNIYTNKLKSCLDKSFNILPSQERLTLTRCDKVAEKESNLSLKTTVNETLLQCDITELQKIASVERKQDNTNASPRQSVRKLIETFTPVDEPLKISNLKLLGPLRCVRKVGVPVLPPTIPAYRGLEPLSHKSSILSTDNGGSIFTGSPVNTCTFSTHFPCPLTQDIIKTDTNEFDIEEDFENFPPPPLEILMDDSFNRFQPKEHEKGNTKNIESISNTNSSFILKKMGASHKIKSSVNLKDLLPNKNATDVYSTLGKTFRNLEENVTPRTLASEHQLIPRQQERGLEIQRNHEIEQAAHLYKQSHKIIPLQNPGEVETVSNNGEIQEPCIDEPSILKQKQWSNTSYKRNDKSPTALKRIPPTRTAVLSPSIEKKMTNPPTNKSTTKTHYNIQQSPPLVQKNAISGSTTKMPSPPTQRKIQSPSSQRKLQSPPQIRKPASPPRAHRLPSPPSQQPPPSPPNQRKLTSLPSQQTPPICPLHTWQRIFPQQQSVPPSVHIPLHPQQSKPPSIHIPLHPQQSLPSSTHIHPQQSMPTSTHIPPHPQQSVPPSTHIPPQQSVPPSTHTPHPQQACPFHSYTPIPTASCPFHSYTPIPTAEAGPFHSYTPTAGVPFTHIHPQHDVPPSLTYTPQQRRALHSHAPTPTAERVPFHSYTPTPTAEHSPFHHIHPQQSMPLPVIPRTHMGFYTILN